MNILFEFKVNVDDDYLLFNQYQLLNSRAGKRTLLSFNFIVPFVCLAFILIFIVADFDFQLILFEAIMLRILSILWICYSKKIIFKSIKKNIMKMKKEGRLPYTKEAILKFDDESIHEITPNTESKTNYSMIEKVSVTEKAIYLFINSVQAYILPVTAFSGEMEKSKFLEFINLKVDNLIIAR